MRSMRVDCGPVRMAGHADLDRYMDGSTGTVGRILAPLLGAPERSDEFARLGVAFQLTNFIRDVGEDWRLDRLYLPGLREADVADGEATPGFRERLSEEGGRARAPFAEAPDAGGAGGRPSPRGTRGAPGAGPRGAGP